MFEQLNHQHDRVFAFGGTFSLARRYQRRPSRFRPQSSPDTPPPTRHLRRLIFFPFLAGRLDRETISSPRIRQRWTTTPQPTNPVNCSGLSQRLHPTLLSASITTASSC